MKRTILIALLLCSAAGCTDYWRYNQRADNETSGDEDEDHDTDEGAPITDADRARGEQVVVLESLGNRRAEVVGLIDVHEETGNESRGLTDLRARAAQVGAEALTSVEVHPPASGENITHFSGMAIRFNDLLRGRPYDVIAEIDVDASMLHEDDAYAELRRRAREMHADLLLDVRFDHGDGTGPLHLRAQAIHIRQ